MKTFSLRASKLKWRVGVTPLTTDYGKTYPYSVTYWRAYGKTERKYFLGHVLGLKSSQTESNRDTARSGTTLPRQIVGEIMRGAQELITRKLTPFCTTCNRTAGFAESAGVAGNPASGQAP